ncbi:restriction endonuclease subunit S [Serinicoccus sediminis]|uniref:restriction endonuclease subunit S n=1 Tax=Serinicoccus sediminis TaxID=2306021 RepID=UPI001EDFE1D9|nr:restriction endonuclease subunit S [Serinicoccus sediminis]
MFKAESYVGHKLCWPEDLVINSLWAWGRGLGVSRHHGIVSTAYGVYRQRGNGKLLPDYLDHLVRSQPYQWELQVRSQGVWKSRLQMTDARWLDAPLLVPPAEEQEAIVKYLTHANTRIDKAIAAKRRLIALLEEQQRAVVRESLVGVSWGFWPLGRLGRLVNGSTPSRSQPEYWGGEIPWLNSSVVNQNAVEKADQFVTAKALEECHLPLVPPRSVLIGITGQGKTRGMATILRFESTINQHLASLTPDVRCASAEYVALALTAAYPDLRRLSDGSGGTKGALTLADLKSFRIPLPPMEVQLRVVEELEAFTKKQSLTVARIIREIEFLQEFRTRLVADVVTGQVDVRVIAASLPRIAPITAESDPEVFEDVALHEIDDVMEMQGA